MSENDFVATDDDLKDMIGELDLPEVLSKEITEISEMKQSVSKFLPKIHDKSNPEIDSEELEREEDFQFVRKNLYDITEKALSSLTSLTRFAEDNKHPRAFEVIAKLITTIADAQKDLLAIHEMNKRVQNIGGPRQEITNNNLIMPLTTEELDVAIKEFLKSSDIKTVEIKKD